MPHPLRWILQLLRLLPPSWRNRLDAWSHRVAQARALRRQERWRRRQLAAAPRRPA